MHEEIEVKHHGNGKYTIGPAGPDGSCFIIALVLLLGGGAVVLAIAIAPIVYSVAPWAMLIYLCFAFPLVGIPAMIMSIIAVRRGVEVAIPKVKPNDSKKWKWLRYWMELWGKSILPTLSKMIIFIIICAVITFVYAIIETPHIDEILMAGFGVLLFGVVWTAFLPLLPTGIITLKYRKGSAPVAKNKDAGTPSDICSRCGGLTENGICPCCGEK